MRREVVGVIVRRLDISVWRSQLSSLETCQLKVKTDRELDHTFL
jgi:hypothetical protein